MNEGNRTIRSSRLGLGTWQMGFHKSERNNEIAALRAGISAGISLIDTAEMYANGGAEEVVGEAIAGIREQVFIVTKVLPSNASYAGTLTACEQSLRRLNVDLIDLYLLHWHSSHPLAQTIEAFETLRHKGWIKQWGVSNFDLADMQKVIGSNGGENCAVNQLYYSLSERGIEYDLLPWQETRDIVTMAYCPFDQGWLLKNQKLQSVAEKHRATRAQIALAWLMLQPNVIPIPKSASVERTLENARARQIVLDDEDTHTLDRLFPPPTEATPLKTS